MTQPTETETETRVTRLCDVCGQLDDHPRHVTSVPPGTPGAVPSNEWLEALPDSTPPIAVAQVLDPTTIIRHMDCCAEKGCQICAATLSDVPAGTTGPDLIAHLTQPTEA